MRFLAFDFAAEQGGYPSQLFPRAQTRLLVILVLLVKALLCSGVLILAARLHRRLLLQRRESALSPGVCNPGASQNMNGQNRKLYTVLASQM